MSVSSTEVHTYDVYGLRVRSQLVLPGARLAGRIDAGAADLDIVVADPAPVPREVPEGDALAIWEAPERFLHGVIRQGEIVLFRIPEVVDLRCSPSEAPTLVEVIPATSERLELAAVLAAGALFAVLFELEGVPILHASGIEVDGRAVAIVGASGRGKSTTSALLCRAGHRLVTDDLLRLRFDGSDVRSFRGTTSLRLREKAAALVGSFDGPRRTSSDGRLLVTPTPVAEPELPLAAIVFPFPVHDEGGRVDVRRLTASAAFDELLASPRLLGWEDPKVLTNLFTMAGRLARAVPAFALHIPWGRGFSPEVGIELSETVTSLVEHHRSGS